MGREGSYKIIFILSFSLSLPGDIDSYGYSCYSGIVVEGFEYRDH